MPRSFREEHSLSWSVCWVRVRMALALFPSLSASRLSPSWRMDVSCPNHRHNRLVLHSCLTMFGVFVLTQNACIYRDFNLRPLRDSPGVLRCFAVGCERSSELRGPSCGRSGSFGWRTRLRFQGTELIASGSHFYSQLINWRPQPTTVCNAPVTRV